jgi:SAM-dependent methyltransferase
VRHLNAVEIAVFDLRSFVSYAPRPLARRILGLRYQRTASANIGEYDAQRASVLARMRSGWPDRQDYFVRGDSDPDQVGYFLDAGRLAFGSPLGVQHRLQQRLIDRIASFGPRSVLEFGSGSGRNLLAIKAAHPDVECIGLELTEASVALARAASEAYGLPVRTYQADVTAAIPDVRADIVFSVHALENIPDAQAVLALMLDRANIAVVLYEPIIEVLGWGLRDVAARIRAYHLDRLRGLGPSLHSHGAHIQRLDDAENVLNPTTEVMIRR